MISTIFAENLQTSYKKVSAFFTNLQKKKNSNLMFITTLDNLGNFIFRPACRRYKLKIFSEKHNRNAEIDCQQHLEISLKIKCFGFLLCMLCSHASIQKHTVTYLNSKVEQRRFKSPKSKKENSQLNPGQFQETGQSVLATKWNNYYNRHR